MKYKASAIMVLTIVLLLLVSYFVPFKKSNNSENRTLATFHMVLHPEPDSIVYHESPVERLNEALSDQFPFRDFVVNTYLGLFNQSANLTYELSKSFINDNNNQYTLHSVGNYELIDDTGYITARPTTDPMDPVIVQERVDQLEYLHAKYPNLKIYTYYVSQAFDTPWFNSCIGTTAADHYQEIVDAVPDYVKTGHLVYKDLDDYTNVHYKTDHHWNHRGAERGYEDIYKMMNHDFDLGKMRIPVCENKISDKWGFVWLGSYGISLGELYDKGYDDFYYYDYNLPTREVEIINPDTLEEIQVAKIGLYDEYEEGLINKDIGNDHYIMMYGTARGKNGDVYADESYPFIIRNSEGNRRNLIITGDSYARAIRDVLASHFDTTVYLDYRTLSNVPIDYIIDTYDIDTFLICSHESMWNSEDYLFRFRGDK